MLITIKGLVVQDMTWRDNDKILHVLTAESGKVAIIAKGAKSIKNRYMTACQLFAYSQFTVYASESSSLHRLRDAELIRSFYEVSSNIEVYSLASYIADVASQVCTEGDAESGALSLTLNTLYALGKNSYPLYHIKAVYELRLMASIGFMPDLLVCAECGMSTGESLYLDTIEGSLLCTSCYDSKEQVREYGAMVEITSSILAALRHIIYAQTNKIFAFTLAEDQRDAFTRACERFMLDQIGHSFKTLTFYQEITENSKKSEVGDNN